MDSRPNASRSAVFPRPGPPVTKTTPPFPSTTFWRYEFNTSNSRSRATNTGRGAFASASSRKAGRCADFKDRGSSEGKASSEVRGGNSEGRSSITSWVIRSGYFMSFKRCRPRVRKATPTGSSPRTSGAVVADSNTCPPCPAWAMRAARCTSMPT